MSGVAVVTDPTADLAPDAAAAAGITVVPLFVRFGADEYRVGIDLTTEQFWARMLAPGAPFPTTAAPSPGAFRTAFEACFAAGAEAIVCPTIGSKLSATFQSAALGAAELPGREIHVIDMGSTSMSTRIPALLAVELAAAGAPAADIAARVRDRLADVDCTLRSIRSSTCGRAADSLPPARPSAPCSRSSRSSPSATGPW